ncbi:amino acid ABC transporter, periplasmic arginine/lysine/histidine-binding protein [Campylobacter pinnipediorum subsp. pinnipediorum]|uniref:transporter substrate-binding domain-containing protein n=1 Tax=Campylobacter pinnipediorum TaxID=1965231 RepID=UPI000995BA29|nr:transporter substrate-binding domain-containing protein [Campylobacter pinnipediorum]AQW81064.1 amino acid ABC transporter, periplasmic arginine/lysine/histidine-binding protein [Campylobacter pinnipediorum subsp. pinnipediorum]AQW84369.1 amino acid ABC transporter, periplasmic arginine/lysine/histidine-binding protein [Campylobacter pinnipediorum subsp. pinnipediorum]
MKKFLLFLAFAVFFMGCMDEKKEAKVADVNSSKQEVVKLGVSMDYPPFEFIDDNNNPAGFDIELMQAVAKKVGFELELNNISFDGLIPALKAGKIDAIMSAMSATEDRRKSVDFSDTYYSTENLFIRKKGSDVNQNSLVDKQIGVQLGTLQESAAKKIEGAKVIPADNVLSAIMGLKAGKIDVVLIDSSIGYGYLKQNEDLEEFYKVADGSEGFSIAFEKDKKAELIKKINSALKELKDDGTFEKIEEKYNLK